MMKEIHYSIVCLALLVATSAATQAGLISTTDLWDVSQGSIVDVHSGVISTSDIRGMFGWELPSGTLGNTLFTDGRPVGYTHFVEWHTLNEITLRSFNLHASPDGTVDGITNRAFSQFTLYYATSAGGAWTAIYDTGPDFSYVTRLDLEVDLTNPVIAQYFRAEFVQAEYRFSSASGPRILELDGFATYLDGSTDSTSTVPESTSIALFGLGSLGMGLIARRRKHKQNRLGRSLAQSVDLSTPIPGATVG